jgi:hypothetical protein
MLEVSAARLLVVAIAGALCYIVGAEGILFIRTGGWEHGVVAGIAFVLVCGWIWIAAWRKPRWRGPHS